MHAPQNGDIYKILHIAGEEFIIRYGFYPVFGKNTYCEPEPIFPDFTKVPLYTAKGEPFVTADQDICTNYLPKSNASGEEWCNDCLYFVHGEDTVGICCCSARRCNLRKNE